MKIERLTATKRLGPIVCLIMEGDNNPQTTQGNHPDGNMALHDEENLGQPGFSDDTIPAGEEQNIPDPEEFEERQGDENFDDMPMEEPVPDLDEIEPDEVNEETIIEEEQNIPDTFETPEIEENNESEGSGVTPDIIDIPRSTPSRSKDTIGPDHEPQVI